MKLRYLIATFSTVGALDLIVKLGEDRAKCRRPFIDQKEFVTSKRGKILDKHNLHSCCSFKSFTRKDDDRCFGQIMRTFSFNHKKRECVPVNIRALCEKEENFNKLNLFRSRNKCESTCTSNNQPQQQGRQDHKNRHSLLDRDRNREGLLSELGLGSSPQRPMWSGMFKPPLIMTGRSVFGANPNRAGNDEYFNRLKEMHNRGGYKNEMFLDSVPVNVELLDDGRPKLCRKQMKPGKTDSDTAVVLKWYFNWETNACSEFYFNGKGGNENQFDTHAECMNTCYIEVAEEEETESVSNPQPILSGVKTARSFKSNIGEYGMKELMPLDLCSRPAPSSFCNTKQVSSVYYFNSETGDCEVFLVGGCDSQCQPGECNRFSTLEDCNYYCS